MAKSFFIKDAISEHFKNNKKGYIFSLLSVLIGIIVGLYLSFADYSYTSLLSSSDKNIFDYVTGSVSYSSVFYSRLLNNLLFILIIFVLNLTVFTSFLSLIFIGYQTCLIVLSCTAIISLYGFSGVLNVVLLVVPINVLNLVIILIMNSLCFKRAYNQNKYKLRFIDSFKEEDFLKQFFICLVISFILCFIYCFIVPLFIKSFVVINY